MPSWKISCLSKIAAKKIKIFSTQKYPYWQNYEPSQLYTKYLLVYIKYSAEDISFLPYCLLQMDSQTYIIVIRVVKHWPAPVGKTAIRSSRNASWYVSSLNKNNKNCLKPMTNKDIIKTLYFTLSTTREFFNNLTILSKNFHGTLDNNPAPDHLAGPKALDLTHFRQPSLLPSELWKVMSCALFGPRHFPYSYYQFRATNITAVCTIFNIFSYDAVRTDNWTDHLLDADRMRYVLSHRHGFNIYLIIKWWLLN